MKTITSLLLLIIASSTIAGDLTTGYTFSQGEANITHLKLNQAVNDAVVVSASASLAGKVELATDAESITGTDALRAVTPASLKATLASPITIGSASIVSGDSNGGSGTSVPVKLILHDTDTGSAYDLVTPVAAVDFSSADTSTVGAGVRARIGIVAAAANGGSSKLSFFTSPTTAGTMVEAGSFSPAGGFTSTIAGATTSVPGTVELATSAETLTGTDTARAVTPADLGAYNLGSQVTTVGNVGSGEDTLWSQAIGANTLSVNGQAVRVVLTGAIGAMDAPRIRVKWGAVTILDNTLSTSFGEPWKAEALIVRTGAATQRCIVTLDTGASGGTPLVYTAATETLSGSVNFVVTAEESSDNAATLQIAKANFVP